MTEKRNIHALIEKEAPSLNNLLGPEDVKEFKAMTAELRDTWTKKQVFSTDRNENVCSSRYEISNESCKVLAVC